MDGAEARPRGARGAQRGRTHPSPDSLSSRPFRRVSNHGPDPGNSWDAPQPSRLVWKDLTKPERRPVSLCAPRPPVPASLEAVVTPGATPPDSGRPSYLGFRGGPRRLGGQRQAHPGHLWLLAHLWGEHAPSLAETGRALPPRAARAHTHPAPGPPFPRAHSFSLRTRSRAETHTRTPCSNAVLTPPRRHAPLPTRSHARTRTPLSTDGPARPHAGPRRPVLAGSPGTS